MKSRVLLNTLCVLAVGFLLAWVHLELAATDPESLPWALLLLAMALLPSLALAMFLPFLPRQERAWLTSGSMIMSIVLGLVLIHAALTFNFLAIVFVSSPPFPYFWLFPLVVLFATIPIILRVIGIAIGTTSFSRI